MQICCCVSYNTVFVSGGYCFQGQVFSLTCIRAFSILISMIDYLFGMLLFAFGLGSRPTVLGEQSTDSAAKPLTQLRLMRPKFTAEEQQQFQLERRRQEANIKKISDARIKELEQTYAQKQAARQEKDGLARSVLDAKLAEFQDAQKKQKVAAISGKYQQTVTDRLAAMQTKLQSMMTLSDRITAAAGALKAQGTDVSHIEADVAGAQAKISSAIFDVNTLVESLPTVIAISGEDGAGEDIRTAIASARTRMEAARVSFAAAHAAVGKALAGLEELTDAVQVGPDTER